jgi:hypothetical protein
MVLLLDKKKLFEYRDLLFLKWLLIALLICKFLKRSEHKDGENVLIQVSPKYYGNKLDALINIWQ